MKKAKPVPATKKPQALEITIRLTAGNLTDLQVSEIKASLDNVARIWNSAQEPKP
jgi:hypothetical protein